ncbi:hypothetical protein [Klebsiella pneumoniae]|nr:hypothetical protein [Klebsiella pneumoniae]
MDRLKGLNIKVLHTIGRTGACNARI